MNRDKKFSIFGLFMAFFYTFVLTYLAYTVFWNDIVIALFSVGYGVTAYLFIVCIKELRKKDEKK